MLKLSADFDFELAFSKLDKRMQDQQEAMQRYLSRPHADIRDLFAVVNGAASPVLIDLGSPAGGLMWSVQQVCLMTGVTLSSAAAANVSAGIFTGSIPSVLQFNLDVAALKASGLSVPGNYQAGGKSIVIRSHQHLYVVLQGSGTNANAWTATATVLQVPDTSEALLWL
jgi:hypothetical protein